MKGGVMNKIQELVVKTGAKMILNEKQEISLTKLGGNIVALAAVALTMPSMGFNVSADILNIAKLAIAIGGAMGWSGARDAIGKTSK